MPKLKFAKPKCKVVTMSTKARKMTGRGITVSRKGKKKLVSQTKTMRKKAEAVFHQFIRLRDCLCYTPFMDWARCYTCLKDFKYHQLEAGHFKHNKLDFDERNLHAQCAGCNKWGHGKLDEYATHLVKDYGPKILEELNQAVINEPKKRTLEDYEKIFNLYTQKVKELNEKR